MSYRVFIGVGHGGSDPGAVKHVKEAWANLVVAKELAAQLKAAGLIVGMSRTVDEDDPIGEEIREANAFDPDLAVEVHNNAGGGDGFEVFVQSNGYAAQSMACAQAIEAEVKAIGQQSRGIKTNSFGWTRNVNAPAVLTEGFFVDNLADAQDFDTEVELQDLGRAYARGVLKYLEESANIQDATPDSPQDANTAEKILYRVQAGAFKEKTYANAALAAVRAAGFDAVLVWVEGWFKVQIGAFAKVENANAQLEKVRAAGFDAFITTKGDTSVKPAVKKSLEDIALEVARGKWGNGIERKNKLEAAGYTTAEYIEIQNIVNRLV